MDNFNDEDILSAKDTLHSHVSTTLKHRRIKRQGADKAKHNVDDISKILDEADPDAIPIYVACDLSKLPTIDFNHVDMSTRKRDKKNIHPVINNHTLPYTEKCKYLGHIINNNLTDDDDIARQKRCIYTQANALARKFYLCNNSIKTT